MVSLPSEGALVSGNLRNLSLGGCGIITSTSLPYSTRAEIQIRVNASSFRAVGRVRTIAVPSWVGLEFLQLSSRGQEMLRDMIDELARHQAIMRSLRAARTGSALGPQDEQGLTIWNGLPIVGNARDDDGAESPLVAEHAPVIVECELDLFI